MPHVGGGSNSGGFHSSGSSSSGVRSIPKKDIYGNTHSHYYLFPGFYVNHVFVPYSRVHRMYYAIRRFLIFIFLGIILLGAGIASIFFTRFDSALEDYSLERYSALYDNKSSNYEYNIMIEIVAYDNLNEIDYMPIAGDNVNVTIDNMFGNEKTTFGGEVARNSNLYKEPVTNIYKIIEDSLHVTNNQIATKYYNGNTYQSRVSNNTEFNLGSSDTLELELKRFYETTGYNIIIDISNYKEAYPIVYPIVILLFAFSIFMFVYSIYCIIRTIKAVKKINEEDKNGNLEMYYEGEVSYREHIKAHPIDEPYMYKRSEYDALRKEFELDKKKLTEDNTIEENK